jgi:hypothetical protein
MCARAYVCARTSVCVRRVRAYVRVRGRLLIVVVAVITYRPKQKRQDVCVGDHKID